VRGGLGHGRDPVGDFYAIYSRFSDFTICGKRLYECIFPLHSTTYMQIIFALIAVKVAKLRSLLNLSYLAVAKTSAAS
jgi:hypothetical protein